MRFVKEVKIVFKTRKDITVPATYFGDFKLDNISRRVRYDLWITERQQAGTVAMKILKEVDEIFDAIHMIGIDEHGIVSHITAANDITALVLHYRDGTQETFYVDYHMDFDDTNPYQKTYVDESGNVYIVIARDKAIEDFFDIQNINHPDSE